MLKRKQVETKVVKTETEEMRQVIENSDMSPCEFFEFTIREFLKGQNWC